MCGLATQELPVDTARFATLGAAMWSGHLGQVYATDWNQSGPFQLALSYLLATASGNPISNAAVHVIGNLAAMAALLGCCAQLRRHSKLPPSATVEFVAGCAFVLLMLLGRIWSGHPADAAIPVMWLFAAIAARQGRPLVAGALLGTATGWECWAVLCAPLIFLVDGWTPRLRAGLAFISTGIAVYLPFVATGHFALFKHVWPIRPGTPVQHMFPDLTGYPWQLRILQATLAVAGCTIVVLLGQKSVSTIWLAPAVTVILRFILDPLVLDYYWTTLVVVALAGVCLFNRRTLVLQVVLVGITAYLAQTGATWPVASVGVGVIVIFALVALDHLTTSPIHDQLSTPSARPNRAPAEASVVVTTA